MLMFRLRTAMATLIPALVLLVSGLFGCDTTTASADEQSSNHGCFCDSAAHPARHEILSVDASKRAMARRGARSFNSDGFPRAVLNAPQDLLGVRGTSLQWILPEPPRFVRQWQFSLRAALEPRAPSFAN